MTKKKGLRIREDLLGKEAPALPEVDHKELDRTLGGLTPEEAQLYTLMNARGSGAAKKPPLDFEVARELTTRDLLDFQEAKVDGRAKSGGYKLNKIRSIHHQIAQYLVQGYKNNEVSALLGVTAQRISQLQQDPAFKELLQTYQESQQSVGASIIERLRTIAVLGLEEVQDRLLDDPDLFSNPQIYKLVELALDRSGHAPAGANQKPPGQALAPDQLEQLKAEVKNEERSKIVTRKNEYVPKDEGE